MKDWLLRNIGPTVSIVVTVVSGVVSVVIYVLEFLEENKKKIDDIRNRVKEILKDLEKEKQAQEQETQAIENADKDTFKKTLLQIAETFLGGCSRVVKFIRDHIEALTVLAILFALYEIYDRPSPREIHGHLKKKLREKLS